MTLAASPVFVSESFEDMMLCGGGIGESEVNITCCGDSRIFVRGKREEVTGNVDVNITCLGRISWFNTNSFTNTLVVYHFIFLGQIPKIILFSIIDWCFSDQLVF